jgi:hypothetical protein
MKPAGIWDWIGPFILVAGFGAYLFASATSGPAICGGEQTCFREWVGALSGWAALLGALLTINVMQEQLSEQRRQTDHIKGENPPDIFFDRIVNEVGGDYYSEVAVTVVNRNRRPLTLENLAFSGLRTGASIGVHTTTVGADKQDLPMSDFLQLSYIARTIPGKEDGLPAGRCVIRCYVFLGSDLAKISSNPDQWQDYPVVIEVRGVLKDAEDRPITLKTSGLVTLDAD